MAWIYKRPGSKKWWIGWRANGGQFLKSTGTTDKAQAAKKLHEQEFMLQAQIDGRLTDSFYEALTGKTLPSVTLAAAAKDWLAEARATTARGTVEKYEHVIKDFLEHVKPRNVRVSASAPARIAPPASRPAGARPAASLDDALSIAASAVSIASSAVAALATSGQKKFHHVVNNQCVEMAPDLASFIGKSPSLADEWNDCLGRPRSSHGMRFSQAMAKAHANDIERFQAIGRGRGQH